MTADDDFEKELAAFERKHERRARFFETTRLVLTVGGGLLLVALSLAFRAYREWIIWTR